MDMKNWNVDKTQIAAQQEALKKSMNFAYVGHGPKATGFMAKQFKRKPGLYGALCAVRLLHASGCQGEETCLCGNLRRDEHSFKAICPPLKWKSSRARSGKRAQKATYGRPCAERSASLPPGRLSLFYSDQRRPYRDSGGVPCLGACGQCRSFGDAAPGHGGCFILHTARAGHA